MKVKKPNKQRGNKMIETNYTDKTGTYTVLGRHHIPDPSIINWTRFVCELCEKTQVKHDESICDKCAQMLTRRVDMVDHQNRCGW